MSPPWWRRSTHVVLAVAVIVLVAVVVAVAAVMTSGGDTSSAQGAAGRPRASASPALRAALTPWLVCACTRMRGSVCCSSQAHVSSADPSSTVISSQSWNVCASTLPTLRGRCMRAL